MAKRALHAACVLLTASKLAGRKTAFEGKAEAQKALLARISEYALGYTARLEDESSRERVLRNCRLSWIRVCGLRLGFCDSHPGRRRCPAGSAGEDRQGLTLCTDLDLRP